MFVAALGDRARRRAFVLTQQLRAEGLATALDYGGASLKSQMRKADKLQVRFVAILGDDEVAQGALQLRDMVAKTQEAVPFDQAPQVLIRRIREGA